ncbi:MAG: azurin [Neisseriaceae bacterium]|nr:azurin [Neisseriaceae bacterium]
MKKLILILSIGLFSTSVLADECEYNLIGTDTLYFQNKQGEVVRQIIVPSSCTDFTINLFNGTKVHKNFMGHNVVVAKSSDVKSVIKDGIRAGVRKDYLKPNDERILVASQMIGGGENTSVKFPVAKIKDDNYDFFCSFIGHDRKMRGKLIVQ